MVRTDATLTTDVGIELDDRGDVKRVTGERDALVQRAVLRAMNVAIPLKGTAITPTDVENARDLIEGALRADEVVDTPVSVRVSDVQDTTVEFTVTLGEQLTFSLTRSTT